MSTLKKFHDFMEILRQYIQIPPPKMSLGQYVEEEIRSLENQDTPMTFDINVRRDDISFLGHIHIRNRGMFSGLVSSLKLQADGIVLTIHHSHSPTDFTDLGEIPFSDIIAFHEIKPEEVRNFFPASENPKRTRTDNRQPEGVDCAHRHITGPAESQPGI